MNHLQINELEACVNRAYGGSIRFTPSPPHQRALDAIAELREAVDSGAGIILNERLRQVSQKGYSVKNDAAAYKNRQLITASEAYLKADAGFFAALDSQIGLAKHLIYKAGKLWPWALNYFKPSEDRVRNLAKAGALIAAEIDRIKAGEEAARLAPADARELHAQLR